VPAEKVGRTAGGPQNAEEHCRGQDRVGNPVTEVDNGFGSHLCVLGDPEFRRIEVWCGDAEPVEALLSQPLADQAVRQPSAPEDLQPHAKHQLQNGDRSRSQR
jgi:hypothetical protein